MTMEWITTSTILERLQDYENASAWNRFVARFRTPIVEFARKMGLANADAEDAAQETLMAFAKAYRKGHYDRNKGRLSKWLFGIAYLHVRRIYGDRARRDAQVESGCCASIPDERDATISWDKTWRQSVLEQCLARVRQEVEPTTYRAFEMTALVKRPAAEVAGELSISRNAVFIAKHRVLTRLRKLQEEYERVD